MRVAVNDCIEDLKGRKFRCIGWGRNPKKNAYTRLFVQFNTDGTPLEFEATEDELKDAFERNKIFWC